LCEWNDVWLGRGYKWSTTGLSVGAHVGALIYINDLDNGIGNCILKFADDTKLFAKIDGAADRDGLRRDLDLLVQVVKGVADAV